jgi:uncharacterized membrane protein YhaH (DUF805 family)
MNIISLLVSVEGRIGRAAFWLGCVLLAEGLIPSINGKKPRRSGAKETVSGLAGR